MAEDKASFILYADLIHTVKKLPKDKAGELFLTILQYVNDENPVIEDREVDLVFEPVKQRLKKDLIKYQKRKQQASEAGKKSAEIRALSKIISGENQSNATTVNEQNQSSTLSTVNVSVSDSDSVNDNVSDIVFNKKVPEKNSDQFPTDAEQPPADQFPRVIETLKITKQVDVSAEKILKLWPLFKLEHLTGKKYYPDVGAIHEHFFNWIKKQTFKNGTDKITNTAGAKLSPSEAREKARASY